MEAAADQRRHTTSASSRRLRSGEPLDKKKIEAEYAALRATETGPVDAKATIPSNMAKNRYGDVLPIEATAVKLKPLNGNENSTYINANFVSDKNHLQSYICSQAPLQGTMGDFWRMIWQQKVSFIVMITKLQEKDRTKADRYWPASIGSSYQYDSIKVNFVKEKILHDGGLTIRTFYIGQSTSAATGSETVEHDGHVSFSGSASGETPEDSFTDSTGSGTRSGGSGEVWSEEDSPSEERELTLSEKRRKEKEFEEECERDTSLRKVVQLHCTEWPDQGIPPSTKSMISLMHELDVRSDPTERELPICVHCSAGIGRTGTFIAIRMCITNWLVGEKVDIFQTVKHLRDQRQGSVQTKEQYRFIYVAVEDVIYEKTQRNNPTIRSKYASELDPSSNLPSIAQSTPSVAVERAKTKQIPRKKTHVDDSRSTSTTSIKSSTI